MEQLMPSRQSHMRNTCVPRARFSVTRPTTTMFPRCAMLVRSWHGPRLLALQSRVFIPAPTRGSVALHACEPRLQQRRISDSTRAAYGAWCLKLRCTCTLGWVRHTCQVPAADSVVRAPSLRCHLGRLLAAPVRAA